ncbi:ribonuclease Z [Ravibacter arvi]|uniref:Ribonuclease Z n=1 Tax=Ravibacter arvi TaxID=2051041 RepID=A0ABP8MDT0_9BACT
MSLSVTILGSGSALPLPGFHPSSQLVAAEAANYLLDCGEGTQFRLRNLKLGFSRIRAICISHLHGDHYYGLFGLLDSMAMTGRTEPLHLVAPDELQSILVEFGRATQSPPAFPIYFSGTREAPAIVYSDELVTIEAFPVEHRIHCTGFLVREQTRQRNMIKEKLSGKLSFDSIRQLKDGKDVLDPDGNVIFSVEEYTTQPAPPKKYAYCADTIYQPSLSAYLSGVDLMYHEATFANEMAVKAHERGHSTASQAAWLARDAAAGKLLIGHASSRYDDVRQLVAEAAAIFPNVEYAEEGRTFVV